MTEFMHSNVLREATLVLSPCCDVIIAILSMKLWDIVGDEGELGNVLHSALILFEDELAKSPRVTV